MANIKSQEKRILISEKERLENKSKKSKVNTFVKKFEVACNEGNVALAKELLVETTSYIDSARLDGVYHANTAARKKSSLQKKFNALSAK